MRIDLYISILMKYYFLELLNYSNLLSYCYTKILMVDTLVFSVVGTYPYCCWHCSYSPDNSVVDL